MALINLPRLLSEETPPVTEEYSHTIGDYDSPALTHLRRGLKPIDQSFFWLVAVSTANTRTGGRRRRSPQPHKNTHQPRKGCWVQGLPATQGSIGLLTDEQRGPFFDNITEFQAVPPRLR